MKAKEFHFQINLRRNFVKNVQHERMIAGDFKYLILCEMNMSKDKGCVNNSVLTVVKFHDVASESQKKPTSK